MTFGSIMPPVIPENRRDRIVAGTGAVLILLLFIARLASTLPGNSATYDESVHVTRGYAALKLHDLRLNVEHPVLGDALAALPLMADHTISFPVDSGAWRMASHWVVADLFIWHQNHQPQHMINLARCSVATMSVLLAILVAIWGAELYGWPGGLLALLLYTFSPNIIANSVLATNDLSLTLFSTLYLWLLWRFMRRPTLPLGIAAAVGLGAAIMCKYSGLVLLVDTTLLMAWWWWRTGTFAGRRPGRSIQFSAADNGAPTSTLIARSRGIERRAKAAGGFWQVFFQGCGLFLGAAVVVWFAYGLHVQPLVTPVVMQQEVGHTLEAALRGGAPLHPDDQIIAEPGDIFHREQPANVSKRYLYASRIPLPAAQYLRGLLDNLLQAKGGHRAFLLGQVSRNGWWYYFPIAFLLKTPIPFLILMTLALASLKHGWEWDESFLLLPCAILMLVAMKSHIDIGIRHLLPMYPLLAIFCGRLIPTSLRVSENSRWGAGLFASVAIFLMLGVAALDLSRHQLPLHPILALAFGSLAWGFRGPLLIDRWASRSWALGTVAILCGWLGIETGIVHPLYLTYFNEIAGGPDQGARYLVDSNLDWGQDLIRLNCALHENHIGSIGLAYFGTAEPSTYGIDYQPIDPKPTESLTRAQGPFYGWVAVSISDLAYYGEPGGGLAWLRKHTPSFTVGHTIWVYHIPVPHVKTHELKKSLKSDQLME